MDIYDESGRWDMKRTFVFIVMMLLMMAAPSFAESFSGQVQMVKDGSNIFVKSGEKTYEVKLYGIDCPAAEQEFGEQSRQYAEDLLKGKEVWVDVKRLDHSKRYVSKVVVDGKDASVELARAGLAWYDSRVYSEPAVAGAQTEAQSSKIGIWSQTKPVAPWDYRYSKSGITPVMSKDIGNIPTGRFDGGSVTASSPNSSPVYYGGYNYGGGGYPPYYYYQYNRPSINASAPTSTNSGPFTNNVINRNSFTNNVINRSY